MKKFTLTVFGLFLVAATFASVKPVEANQKVQTNSKTILAKKAQVTQISKVIAITSKAALGGPRVVVATCANRCLDEL